ncbi:YIP1 family protein [Paraliobacillus sp. JSM ZJ581]|uniref:YIP1 family protein n=1 Tax=Paraliobacillus sp. JSM ZJ581 TaxID=3342118 RepID=UPI0035A82D14
MRKFFTALCCFGLTMMMIPLQSSASDSVSYKTETLTADGKVIETQSAYTPIGIFGKDIEIVNPEDVFMNHEDQLFIVDSGTKLVTKFDEGGKVLQQYGEGLLQQPQGIHVDWNNNVYVTDYGQQTVFKFNESGDLKKRYDKPESPLFGKSSPYKPQKVSVDQRGNLYIVGEGATNGIIQLNQDGEFLGYYGVNMTRPSFGTIIQNLLTTQRKKASLFMKVPPAPNNITIDEQGLLYTVTSGVTYETIRKLNIAGANMLDSDITDVANLQDIAIGPIGNMYVVADDGMIYEYDRFGNLLFIFGGKDDGTDRLGLMQQPSSITVDQVGRLFVTDRENGVIQVFEPTAFTTILHEGLALYAEGHYIQSEQYWNEVLRLNSSFGLAHTAKGEAQYKQQQYHKALEAFKLGNDKEGYSEAFWEVRHRFMQDNLGAILMGIIVLFLLRFVLLIVDRKKGIFKPFRTTTKKIKQIKLIEELLFLGRFITHPIDSLYYLKEYQKVSKLSAIILFGVLLLEYILSINWTGFLFTDRSMEDINLILEIGVLLVPILLFIVANYMVSTITDGEGKFRDVFIGTIYSLAPVILFLVPITLLSNMLTFNEAFIYDFAMQIIIIWSIVLLFIMIKEVHDFTFFGTIRNILITLFAMFIAVLVFFVIYLLFDQVYDFISSIIQEVMLRV